MSPAPTPRTRRGRTGIAAEAVARRYLDSLGWTILGVNLVAGRGELDLVAVDPDAPGVLVVVEVRGARSDRFGRPEESVDRRKLARVQQSALALLRGSWRDRVAAAHVRAVRIDVIAVELDPAIGPGMGGPSLRHLRGVDAG